MTLLFYLLKMEREKRATFVPPAPIIAADNIAITNKRSRRNSTPGPIIITTVAPATTRNCLLNEISNIELLASISSIVIIINTTSF